MSKTLRIRTSITSGAMNHGVKVRTSVRSGGLGQLNHAVKVC
jgi:hypothetical protein